MTKDNEPVAWIDGGDLRELCNGNDRQYSLWCEDQGRMVPLYAAPPESNKDNEPVAWCLAYDDPRMGRIYSNPSMFKPELDALSLLNNVPVVPLYAAPPDLAAKVAELEADITQWQISVLEQGEVIDQLKAQRDELLAVLEQAVAWIDGERTPIYLLSSARSIIARVKGEK